MYIEPNWVFINWGHQLGMKKLVNKTLKRENKKKEENNKFKSIDNYKPTGTIYDESTLLGFSDKLS